MTSIVPFVLVMDQQKLHPIKPSLAGSITSQCF